MVKEENMVPEEKGVSNMVAKINLWKDPFKDCLLVGNIPEFSSNTQNSKFNSDLDFPLIK